MNCENCGNEHDGSYGSGRFCSTKCSRGFSGKKTKEINEKISKTLTKHDGIFALCKYCKTERVKGKNKIYCSNKCASRARGGWSNHDKVDWCQVNANAYKRGKAVAGGTCKWYEYTRTDLLKVKVQGTYELRMCRILDVWKDAKIIFDWEYTNDRISYLDENNKKRTYLLDFKVYERLDSFYYIETKGIKTANDDFKWKEARKKFRLDIFFKEDLSRIEKEIEDVV